MPLLKAFREANLPPIAQLPPAIKGKVLLIEELHDRAMIFMSLRQAMEKETAGLPDFDEYVKTLPAVTQGLEQRELMNDLEGESPAGEPVTERLMLMVNPEYEPGLELSGLLGELGALWYFWVSWPYSRRWEKIESEDEGAFDLNLCKVAYRVGVETANIRHWGKKKEAAARLNLEKKFRADEQKKVILDAFAKVKKEPRKDTLNSIVVRIHKFLGQPKTPSRKNIERTLRGNSRLWQECFQKESRGRMARYIYIGQTSV